MRSSPGRSRTYVACPDSKSGGPCRQTNRGSVSHLRPAWRLGRTRGAVRPNLGRGSAVGDGEDAAEGQEDGAVAASGVGVAQPEPELLGELLAEVVGERLEGGPGTG